MPSQLRSRKKMAFSRDGTRGIWMLTNFLASSIALWFVVIIGVHLGYDNLLTNLSESTERCSWSWSKSSRHFFPGTSATHMHNQKTGIVPLEIKKKYATFFIQIKENHQGLYFPWSLSVFTYTYSLEAHRSI